MLANKPRGVRRVNDRRVLNGIANTTYYQCPNGWLKLASGANGVYYRVVPAP
jgi:hypothetical protein